MLASVNTQCGSRGYFPALCFRLCGASLVSQVVRKRRKSPKIGVATSIVAHRLNTSFNCGNSRVICMSEFEQLTDEMSPPPPHSAWRHNDILMSHTINDPDNIVSVRQSERVLLTRCRALYRPSRPSQLYSAVWIATGNTMLIFSP